MSLAPAYFDELYAASADPWGLATRAYEARKYELTLAALPRRRYRRAFEPGCSVGVLTSMLARRADELVATDVSAAALTTAGRRGLPAHVRLLELSVPREWPSGSFDLIVLSELGYYFDSADLDSFIASATGSLDADGHLIAVHWRTPVPEYPGDAALVHGRLLGSRLEQLAHYEDDHFLLDVLGGAAAARLAGPDDETTTRGGERS